MSGKDTRVKIFFSLDTGRLEESINNWIQYELRGRILNISLGDNCTAIITYERAN